MYRPPKDLSFYEKLEKLDKQLQHISRRRNNIFIIGDLNSDVSLKPSENGSKLKQILRKHGLSNVIKDYTRVTETSRSTIDLSQARNVKSKLLEFLILELLITD